MENMESSSKSLSKKENRSNNSSKVGSKFTMKSIRKDIEDFTSVNTKYLGEGSYGKVKLVQEKKTGILYAMKIISKANLLNFTSIQNVKREIKIHSKLSHPHIIKLHYFFEDEDNVYMVLEYAKNGNSNFFS